MRTGNTFSIDFIVRKKKNKKNYGLLYARVTLDGDIKEISLKQELLLSAWDHKKEIVKSKNQEAHRINAHIEKVRFHLMDKYRMLQETEGAISADKVKEAYLGRHTSKKSGHTLLEAFQYHKKINNEVLAPGTMKNYNTTEAYLSRFIAQEFNRREDLYLTELDFEFITNLEYYIRTTPLKEHDPCKGNGVYKHMERLKKVVTWTKKLKWIKSDPFEEYELCFKSTKRKKLNIDELISIEKAKFNDSKLEYVRDLFIFACYSGLAYADVAKLDESDFNVTNEGKIWLNTYRKKSEELSPVPLLDMASKIIEKYRDSPAAKSNGTIFPPITNQEINRNLKIIREVCNIQKDMTFHLARHTFATTVTLKNGVPLETVSLLLGHKKLTTTKIYAEVDEEKIEDDMFDVEARLEQRKQKRLLASNQKGNLEDIIYTR